MGITADGLFHPAGILLQVAVDHRMVDPMNGVNTHLFGQPLMGGIILSNHQQAAGILVDAVHNAGTDGSADAGTVPPAQWYNSALTSVPSGLPGAGCTTIPLGLFTTSRWGILIDNVQRNILGLCLQRARVGDGDGDAVPCPDLVPFGHRLAVDGGCSPAR